MVADAGPLVPGEVWQAVSRLAAQSAALAQSHACQVLLGSAGERVKAVGSDMGLKRILKNAQLLGNGPEGWQADATRLQAAAMRGPLSGSYQCASIAALKLGEDEGLVPQPESPAHVERNLRKSSQPSGA